MGSVPADLAALVSMLVYEHRSSETPPAPWFSSDDVRSRARRLTAISEDLRRERACRRSRRAPSARSDVCRARPRMGRRGGLCRGGRRRRTHRRRLRSHDQAAHRSPPAVGDHRPRSRDAAVGRRGRARERSEASSPTALPQPPSPTSPMTIKPGEPWGRTIDRPIDLVVVAGDRRARTTPCVDRVTVAVGPPVFAVDGDLARTLGGPLIDGRPTVNELPVDLVDVRLDGGAVTATACAHVVIRNRWWRGGWWRGSVVVVMNAEFIGEWDVAPRGHPNDGRVEIFEIGSTFGVRHRWQARRRLRSATHVPHPGIATRSVAHRIVELPRADERSKWTVAGSARRPSSRSPSRPTPPSCTPENDRRRWSGCSRIPKAPARLF